MKSNDEKSAPRMKKHIIVLIVILLTGSAALANYVDMVNALNPVSYWRVDDPAAEGNDFFCCVRQDWKKQVKELNKLMRKPISLNTLSELNQNKSMYD
jgi:hypothetical protein